MKNHPHTLTGEGFTLEEADELLRGYTPPAMTKEQRQEYLAALERAAAHRGAEAGGSNGTPLADRDSPPREVAAEVALRSEEVEP